MQRSGPARLPSIDILRGFAILWVLAYHLWTDLRFPDVYPRQSDAFREVPRQLAGLDLAGALAAAGEAFLRVGYLGVPLFMLLSGYSLALSASRRASAPAREARALPRRLRRLLVPYYAAFAITVAFAAALAAVQWQRHGGASLADFLRDGDISLRGEQLLAGVFILPRMFRDEWQFAPSGALWFVVVLLQYYLLFPVLLAGWRRLGPAPFLAAALAITVIASAAMIAANGDLLTQRTWLETAAPFRIIEFAAGMALAQALATGERPPGGASTAALVAAGIALFVAGCVVPLDAGYASLLQWPLIVAGLALTATPLLAKSRGAFERTAPARALAWAGPVSFTLLIVNEPLRSVTHTLRAEDAAPGWVALWVIGGLVPLTLLLARPLAIALGLIERAPAALTIPDLVDVEDRPVVAAP